MARKVSRSLSSSNHVLAEEFQTQFESLSDAVVIVSYDGIIKYVNKSAQNLFGHTSDALIHKPIEQLIPKRFHIKHETHTSVYSYNPKSGPIESTEALYALHKSGEEFSVAISLSPLTTESGSFVVAVVNKVSPDNALTEEYRPSNPAEELLKANKKNLTVFCKQIHHSIEQITALTQSSVLQFENSDPDLGELAKIVQKISAENNKMSEIVTQMENKQI